MPALVVITAHIGVAAHQFRYGFVACGVGGNDVLAARAQRLGLGQYGGYQKRAGVAKAALRHVIKIECMRGGTVYPCRVER